MVFDFVFHFMTTNGNHVLIFNLGVRLTLDYQVLLLNTYLTPHNIIQFHNIVTREWQHYVEYFTIHVECGEYFIEYYQFR